MPPKKSKKKDEEEYTPEIEVEEEVLDDSAWENEVEAERDSRRRSH